MKSSEQLFSIGQLQFKGELISILPGMFVPSLFRVILKR